MSSPTPQDLWTNALAFGSTMPVQQIYETRMENDVDGKILYMGMTITPNGATDEAIWYIVKMYYDINGFIDRVQKPDNDLGLKYVWDDRATYFS